jgi:hypothetical protein
VLKSNDEKQNYQHGLSITRTPFYNPLPMPRAGGRSFLIILIRGEVSHRLEENARSGSSEIYKSIFWELNALD